MFDRVLVVDWSASSVPKRGADSIWIAERYVERHRRRAGDVWNPSTRSEAAELLDGRLDAEPRSRTLIGVDFSLGFPTGFAAALGLDGVPWSTAWQLLAERIHDDGRNRNNRFVVAAELNRRISGGAEPFWGCPPSSAGPTLTTTKPAGEPPLPPWRATEERLRSLGHRPFSSWQLLGAGSVGSQSLLGIPVLEALRRTRRIRRVIDVWPFTTGLVAPEIRPGGVVIAEVWPTLFSVPDGGPGPKDRRQVTAVAEALADAAGTGDVASWWWPDCAATDRDRVVAEEGWVLAPTPPTSLPAAAESTGSAGRAPAAASSR